MTSIQAITSRYPFNALDEVELSAIQQATLKVLAEVGVKFPSEKALAVFAAHGAEVDDETQVVRLQPDLVTAQMAKAPREYILAGRTPGNDLHLGSGSSYFGTDGCGTQTIDLETGESRASNKEDVGMMALAADSLSSISFYWPMVSAQEFGKLAPLHEMDASFRNTAKHVQTETVMGEELANYAVKMAEVIAGGKEQLAARPSLSSLVCTIAPLGQDREGIEGAMVFAKAGVPVGFMGMPTMGTTAPATPGGALVIANAETVSAMVLMQLVSPGAPVFQAILASALHPQSADYLVSTPEKYLCNAAAVQLSHDWGVPSLAGTFGVDSKYINSWQLGRDSVYTALLNSMAGTDITIGLGMLAASTVLRPEQIIFDDEIYHINRGLTQGLNITAETLPLDVIAAVGSEGHYLSEKHTRENLRQRWLPKLTHPLTTGSENGKDDITQRAKAKLVKILAEHKPPPLRGDQEKELDSILSAAENEIGI